jgi:hypothetical protein
MSKYVTVDFEEMMKTVLSSSTKAIGLKPVDNGMVSPIWIPRVALENPDLPPGEYREVRVARWFAESRAWVPVEAS